MKKIIMAILLLVAVGTVADGVQRFKCNFCNGTGWQKQFTCFYCKGAGYR